MPFQSSPSLKAARAFRKRARKKRRKSHSIARYWPPDGGSFSTRSPGRTRPSSSRAMRSMESGSERSRATSPESRSVSARRPAISRSSPSTSRFICQRRPRLWPPKPRMARMTSPRMPARNARALTGRPLRWSGLRAVRAERSSAAAAEHGAPWPDGGRPQLLLDAQELVVLRGALAARERPRLDLSRVDADREVGDEGVLGFTRPVRDHRAVASPLGQLDRLERLGERADLVDLDEHGVREALPDALLQDGGIGHEQVVAHELGARAETPGQFLPAGAVVLAETVLDRADRIPMAEPLVEGDHL